MTDLLTARLNLSIAVAPGGIEEQEAQGQQNLVRSTTLPIKGDWEVLERWGVQKGEPIDKLFCYCTLPDGWTKAPTDHSLWSSLVDARGLIRASIFYKAAFYDHDAFFHSVRRFTVAKVFRSEETSYFEQVQVRDNRLSRVVFVDTPVYAGELDDGKVVAIKGSNICSLRGNKLCLIDGLKAGKVLTLSKNAFRDRWRSNVENKYVFTDACEELATLECQEYITQFPTDDSIWEPAFDFPETA
jgi:hypothetical protein